MERVSSMSTLESIDKTKCSTVERIRPKLTSLVYAWRCNTTWVDLHLKEISFNYYRCKKPDVNFAKFFVLHAEVLKVMRFVIIYNHNNRLWAYQCRKLHVKNKASRESDFELRSFSGDHGEFYSYTSFTKDAHDFQWMIPLVVHYEKLWI
jgi:hypothetical protein